MLLRFDLSKGSQEVEASETCSLYIQKGQEDQAQPYKGLSSAISRTLDSHARLLQEGEGL